MGESVPGDDEISSSELGMYSRPTTPVPVRHVRFLVLMPTRQISNRCDHGTRRYYSAAAHLVSLMARI